MQRLLVLITHLAGDRTDEGILRFRYGTLENDCCKDTRQPDQLLPGTYADALDFTRIIMAMFNDVDLQEVSTLSSNVLGTVQANHVLIGKLKTMLTRETRKDGKLEFVRIRWIV